MEALTRRQVYMTPSQWGDLQRMAEDDGISVSHVVRDVLDLYLQALHVERHCDLCGQSENAVGLLQVELWTGNNLMFCSPCYTHQIRVVAALGEEAYRRTWERDSVEPNPF